MAWHPLYLIALPQLGKHENDLKPVGQTGGSQISDATLTGWRGFTHKIKYLIIMKINISLVSNLASKISDFYKLAALYS